MPSNDWSDAERRVERAQELFEQRKWLEALDELREATTLNPYNAAWFFNIGLTLDELGRVDEAIDAYRQALALEPDDVQSLTHLGVDLHQSGRFDEALRTFERVEVIDADHEPSYCHRILTYSELGDHEKAEEMFYLARLYKEHCPSCYYNIGCSLAARGLFDKAIYCWQKTLDLQASSTHPQVHIRIAEALWNKGDLEQARRHYLTGLRQDSGNTATLLDLAELLMDMRRFEEAGEKIRAAIELAPENPAGHCVMGRWMLRRGKDVDAIASLHKALQLDPTYPGAHLQLGQAALRRKDTEEARKHLRAELMLRPEDPHTLMDLSNMLLDVGETRNAVACLKRLVHIEPRNAAAWQNLSVGCFLRSRYDEGIEACQEALKLDAENLSIVHNLALALGHLGRYDEALAVITEHQTEPMPDEDLSKLEFRLKALRLWSRSINFFKRAFGVRRITGF